MTTITEQVVTATVSEQAVTVTVSDEPISVTISAAPGPQGPAGVGVPTGGTTGQALVKASGDDYDTAWGDVAGGGGGAVDSVNGETGVVVLDAADVGADPAGTAAGLVATEATARGDADSALDTRVDALELAPPAHAHAIADTTGLQAALDAKADNADVAGLDTRVDALEAAPPAHTHDDRYYTEAEADALLADKADASALTAHEADTTAIHGIADTAALVLTDDARLTDARTPTAHTHAIADTTGLQAALDGKADDGDLTTHAADTTSVHGIADTSALYRAGGTDVAVADGGTGASTAADARTNLGAAAATHSHAQSDVTNLTSDLALKAPLASPALTGTPTAPTATAGTNTTQLATTAFVTGAVGTEATARADADTALDGRVDALELAPPAHASSHGDGGADELALAGEQITTGTVAAARLPAASTSAAGVVELATSAETTAGLAVQASDTRLSDARTPTGSAGGVLSGTYPNPGFAADMATQAELEAHTGNTSNPHSVTAAQAGAEPALGSPGSDGYVLSSTAAGVRSWVAQSGGGALDGSGTAGRVAQWSDGDTLAAANLIGPASNVLTLAAGGAYTLTVPATGTAALLGTANLFTAAQTVQGSGNGTWLTVESGTSDRMTLGYNATGGRLGLLNSSAVESIVFDFLNATTPRFYLSASGGRFFGAVAGSGGSVFAYDSAGYFGIEGVNSIASIGNNVNDYKFVSWSGGQFAVGNNIYASQGNSMTAPSRQSSIYINNAAWLGLLVKGAASQSGNLQEWQSSGGTVYGTVSENGYYTTRKTSAPADAELATGELALWFDSTAGAARLMVKAKNASGTVVTGSVTLS